MKIFLLEDDYSLNEAIFQVLELNNNIIVDRFYNGEDAYSALNGLYDLYILDINVPDISGLDILDKIKEFDIEKRVIIMSADNSINTITSAYKKGCIDFIKKPFHLKELELKVKSLQTKKDTININKSTYFDSNMKLLFINNININLTKKEQILLSLLLENQNKHTSYEKIYYYVYDDIICEDWNDP